MRIPIYQVDAFAMRLFEGIRAAVCPLDDWLPDDLLQAIAAENNLAETAFFVEKDGCYDLRWFTPTSEVDLCGHATLAAAHVLFESGRSPDQRVTFRSRSGLLHVCREGGRLTLDFPALTAMPCALPPAMAEGLGAKPAECFKAMDYMAVFNNEEEIAGLRPDFRRLRELDLRGVIVTAPGVTCNFVSRFFAPNFGIDEDPVTGSAHCMLAPFWAGRLGTTSLTARQLSKRSGQLACRVLGGRVFLSGQTVTYLEGTIIIP